MSLFYCSHVFLKQLYGEYNVFSASQLAGRIVGSYAAVDRTKTLSEKTNYQVLDEIPIIGDFNKSFEQLCLERAQEIVQLGRPIDVYWSGGIDSTALLVALITASDNVNQITVKFEKRSIDEYPYFYEKYVSKMNHKLLDDYYRKNLMLDDCVAVTGDLANQLFGHTSMGDIENKDKPWHTIFQDDKFFRFGNGNALSALKDSQEIRRFVFEAMEQQIKKSPVEIRTVFDFYWWLQFSLKWQEMIFLFLTYTPGFSLDEYNNVYHFYRTDDFQRWSIVNHDMKIKNTWESYKYVMKDFIYEFTNDSDYRDNKKTFNSSSADNSLDRTVNDLKKRDDLRKHGKIISAIDSNFNTISIDDIHNYQTYKLELDNENFIKWNENSPKNQ